MNGWMLAALVGAVLLLGWVLLTLGKAVYRDLEIELHWLDLLLLILVG
jgi:hypothetical protein